MARCVNGEERGSKCRGQSKPRENGTARCREAEQCNRRIAGNAGNRRTLQGRVGCRLVADRNPDSWYGLQARGSAFGQKGKWKRYDCSGNSNSKPAATRRSEARVKQEDLVWRGENMQRAGGVQVPCSLNKWCVETLAAWVLQ